MSELDQGRTAEENLEEAMASAWGELSKHHNEVRAKQGLLWNRINSIDLLNTFLSLHGKLVSRFYSTYDQLEKVRVQEAMARYQNNQPQLVEEVPPELAGSPESRKNAYCWKRILSSYCEIHGRLKVELRAWNQDDYKQFETTISDLIQSTSIKKISASN